jgi:hypothetical protein
LSFTHPTLPLFVPLSTFPLFLGQALSTPFPHGRPWASPLPRCLLHQGLDWHSATTLYPYLGATPSLYHHHQQHLHHLLISPIYLSITHLSGPSLDFTHKNIIKTNLNPFRGSAAKLSRSQSTHEVGGPCVTPSTITNWEIMPTDSIDCLGIRAPSTSSLSMLNGNSPSLATFKTFASAAICFLQVGFCGYSIRSLWFLGSSVLFLRIEFFFSCKPFCTIPFSPSWCPPLF